MRAAVGFVAGVALAGVVAAGLWSWHRSDDVRRAMQLTILRTEVAGLQASLAAARDQADALQAELHATRALPAAPPAEPAAPAPAVAGPSRPVAPPAPAPTAARPPAWDATAAEALEHEMARRFGRALTAEQTAFLVAMLATVRDASRGRDAPALDPADPASIREHVARREALLAADAAFRDEVGIGVSEFVRGLSADAIEEAIPPSDAPR